MTPRSKTQNVKLPESASPQSAAFVEAAREVGCDEDESRFEKTLKKVARHKSKKSEEKSSQPPAKPRRSRK